jgi:hypothetical protein
VSYYPIRSLASSYRLAFSPRPLTSLGNRVYKGIIISIRDVIFNKKMFFNSKRTDILKDLYAELDTLIKKI